MLFRTIGVLGNKFSVFLRYTGCKIGLRTRGYVVRGNMFRDRGWSHDEIKDQEYSFRSKQSNPCILTGVLNVQIIP